MKQTFLKRFGAGVLAVSMLAVFAEIQVTAQDGSKALEGSWSTMVTFRNCQTGAAVGVPFPAMNTFARGGTAHEFGIASGLLRGPGHGVWRHLSERNFYSAFQFFRFNADGTFAGRAVTGRYVEVDILGNTYNSTNTTDFFGVNNNFLFTGCATEVGTRFE